MTCTPAQRAVCLALNYPCSCADEERDRLAGECLRRYSDAMAEIEEAARDHRQRADALQFTWPLHQSWDHEAKASALEWALRVMTKALRGEE